MVLAGCVRVCPFVCLFVELGEVELLTMGDTRTVGLTEKQREFRVCSFVENTSNHLTSD